MSYPGIQWDEELSPKDFIVGYLDRFIESSKKFHRSVVEDLASVDHFVDLAIPRHRIQYFKYLGEIVWDKKGSVSTKYLVLQQIQDTIQVELDQEKSCMPKLKPDARLSKLVQALKYKFDKAGISLEGNRDTYVPHVTIMRAGSSGISQVLDMFLPKDIDGTHQKVSTVENSLKSLSSTLPRKLSQHVEYLCESEELSEEERNEVQGLFQSGDAAKLDAGLTRLAELRNPSQDRVVVIMRGIQGSGKTHLVENSVEARGGQSGYAYCSSKQLFHKTGSTSAPDPSELNIAEAYCRSCFLDAMANLCSFIVVDGCSHQMLGICSVQVSCSSVWLYMSCA
ncbi:hypothetical protein OS493_017838 [Desmophyllum pertusum]|uniref:MJ1316 RNA cyclic group end recognition domain-containing protein n=1 Tax=Desmophyllum pertusum TaxID=174260 RepID=A0A9X0CQR0_9CNID|nr:hypothetical protein OS493_017838 [Desmophyllum pertusum]